MVCQRGVTGNANVQGDQSFRGGLEWHDLSWCSRSRVIHSKEPSKKALPAAVSDRPDSSPFKRLLQGGGWLIGGTLLSQICALAASVLAARVLGKEDFGRFGLLRSTFLIMAVFAGASLSLAATKCVAELRLKDSKRTGRIISLLVQLSAVTAITVAIIGALFARHLTANVMEHPELEGALRPGCLYLAATVVTGVQNGVLAGLERFPWLARLSVLDALMQLAGVSLGAWLAGVTGAVTGMAVAGICTTAVRFTVLRRACLVAGTHPGDWRSAESWNFTARSFWLGLREEWLLIRKMAVPAALLGLAVQPFEWWARLELSTGPGGVGEMGVFASAFALSQVVQFIPQQAGQPGLAILTAEMSRGDWATARRLITKLAWIFGASAAVTAIAVILLGKPLLGLFGRDFIAGASTLALMAGAYVIASMARIFSLIVQASGSMWKQVGHSLVWGVVLLGTFKLCPTRDAVSLAWCYVGAFAVFAALQSLTAWQVLRPPIQEAPDR